MANLPEDIVGIICCAAARLREPNPCVDDIKTLSMLGEIIQEYNVQYGSEEGLDWLANDLDEYLQESAWNYGVHRKWKMLTPEQRRDFFVVWI
jgi:hypothetical protein